MDDQKAKAAIIELTGFIPAAGHAVTFWKSEDNQIEERELLPEDYYKTRYDIFQDKVQRYRNPHPGLWKRSGCPAKYKYNGNSHYCRKHCGYGRRILQRKGRRPGESSSERKRTGRNLLAE